MIRYTECSEEPKTVMDLKYFFCRVYEDNNVLRYKLYGLAADVLGVPINSNQVANLHIISPRVFGLTARGLLLR